MKVILEGGTFYNIFVKIGKRPIVNPMWFVEPTAPVALCFQDLGYVRKKIVVDGKEYRPQVHPDCVDPRAALKAHLREQPWAQPPKDWP